MATTVQVEALIAKAAKYAEENPYVVGASAAATLIAGLLVFRKPELKRDGNDYDSQLTGGLKILNNTDHTLKGGEFKSSIVDYEGMFSGARADVGAISSEESVELRKQRYAAMIDHFYNLVTDFCESTC
jgi:hypothetical protein